MKHTRLRGKPRALMLTASQINALIDLLNWHDTPEKPQKRYAPRLKEISDKLHTLSST